MCIILLALLTLAGFGVLARFGSPPFIGRFCIAAPSFDEQQRRMPFNQSELVPGKVNTFILRVEFKKQFKSHFDCAILRIVGAAGQRIRKILQAVLFKSYPAE